MPFHDTPSFFADLHGLPFGAAQDGIEHVFVLRQCCSVRNIAVYFGVESLVILFKQFVAELADFGTQVPCLTFLHLFFTETKQPFE